MYKKIVTFVITFANRQCSKIRKSAKNSKSCRREHEIKINTLSSIGWRASGCVEIIGDFETFKEDIKDLSGCDSNISVNEAIVALINKRKLFVTVEKAIRPNFLDLIHKEK